MVAKVGTLVMAGEVHSDVPQLPDSPPIENGMMSVIQMAISKMDGENGPSMVQTLNGLYDLHVKEQRRQAEMAFFNAFAQFKAKVRPIYKNESSKKTDSGSGAKFGYRYASLDYIASEVDPILSEVGLSYSWDAEVDGAKMKTICTLRHSGGHSVSSSFECPISSSLPIGDQQKYGSVGAYGRRYSLVGVLGLTTTDDDTDAQQGVNRTPDTITAGQADDIEGLLADTKTDRVEWLKYYSVDSVMGLPTAQFERAKKQLERKKGV